MNILTLNTEIDYSAPDFTSWGLSMKGIRAEGRCPVCKERFTHDLKRGFICPVHLTHPNRYTIFIPYKGKVIFRGTDLEGRTLRSFANANSLRSLAQSEIDAKKFDPEKWISKNSISYKFPSLINAWYDEKRTWMNQGQLAPSYIPKLWQYIRLYYLPFFNTFDVREIRTHHIREFSKQLSNGLSAKYKKNILDALRNFFRWLLEDRVISEMPVFRRIEVPEHLPSTISRDIQNKLLASIPTEHKAIFAFLFYQGCRPSEVRSLKWKDIEGDTVMIRRTWSNEQLLERTKTKNQRKIILLPETKAYLPAAGFPDDFVFKHGSRHYGRTFITSLFKGACLKLNLSISLYEATKHSFGTKYINEGVPIDVLMRWFGHKNLATTERYARMNVKDAFKTIVGLREKT